MKRRDFIKKGAGAFAIAAAGTVRGANAPSNRVRLGIVACARYCRGQRVLNHALKVPGVEFVYACDVLENARNWTERHLEKTTGVRPVKEKDVRKILEDKNLDGIICATPDHWHATCAVLAMQAGKHVLPGGRRNHPQDPEGHRQGVPDGQPAPFERACAQGD